LLSTLKRESFDALLLDGNLPDVSSIEVVRRLRAELRLTIPVIFAMARNQEDDVAKALRAGADDYLIKPLRRMELLARLEAVTHRGRHVQLEGEAFEVGAFRVRSQSRSITREQ
jgi:DNA-binding response OmpR family regulator